MEQKKILIAGGTGFVGTYLTNYFLEKGYEVRILSRKSNLGSLNPNLRFYYWNPKTNYLDASSLEDVNIIFNLSGVNIGEKRWTKQQKNRIQKSRIKSTAFLFENIKNYSAQIDLVISSSAVGYYGMNTFKEVLNEKSPNGTDFLANVCNLWEDSALSFQSIGARVVILRKGIVIGNGGAYSKMAALAKCGINTSIGSGKQYLPWIAVSDLARLYEFIINQQEMNGIYNAVAGSNTMNNFAHELAHSLRKPIMTPRTPSFIVKLFFGKMAEMILNGSRISNKKLVQAGFQFEKSQLAQALKLK